MGGERVLERVWKRKWFCGALIERMDMQNRQENSKMLNCKHCWAKMIRKHKNNSLSNWALVNKLFTIGHQRWERFGRPVDGCHVSWTTGKLKSAKTHVTFCSLGTKGSRFCIVQLRRMKSEFILRIPSAKNQIDPRAPSTSTARPNRFGRKMMLCVWWKQRGVVCYDLLKPGKRVNIKCYQCAGLWQALHAIKNRPVV